MLERSIVAESTSCRTAVLLQFSETDPVFAQTTKGMLFPLEWLVRQNIIKNRT